MAVSNISISNDRERPSRSFT